MGQYNVDIYLMRISQLKRLWLLGAGSMFYPKELDLIIYLLVYLLGILTYLSMPYVCFLDCNMFQSNIASLNRKILLINTIQRPEALVKFMLQHGWFNLVIAEILNNLAST